MERRSFTPIYYQLAKSLKSEILRGERPPGSQLPTEEELSAGHGVSRVTVRSALKKLEIEGFIHRVKGKGTYVSSNVERPAKMLLALDRAPASSDSSLHSMIVGAMLKAQAAGAQVQVCSNDELGRLLDSESREASRRPAVLFLRDRSVPEKLLDEMERREIPYLLEGVKPGSNRNWLDIDNRDAMRQVVDHLHSLGHRRFGVYHYEDKRHFHFNERFQAILERLGELGLSQNSVRLVPFPKGAEMERVAYELAPGFFNGPTPPTAIVCVSDLLAAGLMQWLEAAGKPCPSEVSVTGFDDSPICRHMRPPLTSVRQDYYEIGSTASAKLLELMGDYDNRRRQILIKLKLALRGSAAAAVRS